MLHSGKAWESSVSSLKKSKSSQSQLNMKILNQKKRRLKKRSVKALLCMSNLKKVQRWSKRKTLRSKVLKVRSRQERRLFRKNIVTKARTLSSLQGMETSTYLITGNTNLSSKMSKAFSVTSVKKRNQCSSLMALFTSLEVLTRTLQIWWECYTKIARSNLTLILMRATDQQWLGHDGIIRCSSWETDLPSL